MAKQSKHKLNLWRKRQKTSEELEARGIGPMGDVSKLYDEKRRKKPLVNVVEGVDETVNPPNWSRGAKTVGFTVGGDLPGKLPGEDFPGDYLLQRPGEDRRRNLEELARMIRENPAMADALTLTEKADLVKAGVYQANLDNPWVQKALKQAEKQNNLCSICGEKFEGTGHNAEPAARGRCCPSCDQKWVIPERHSRLDRGYEFERIPGTGGKMRDWSKPVGRIVTPEDRKRETDAGDDEPPVAIPFESRMEFGSGTGKTPAAHECESPIPSLKDLVEQFGPVNIPQTMQRVMSEMEPGLMQKFYPRIYEETGRYHSPKVCAAFLANVAGETAKIGYSRTPTAYRLMLPALQPMIERRMPLFFIAPDLLKAIQMTDFVDDIDWTTLRLPYEQGIFMLPKGALVHPEDGDVAMVLWSRFKANQDYKAPIAGWPPTSIGHDAFIIIGLCPQTGLWYDSVFNADVRPMVRLHNLFCRVPGERTPPGTKYTRLDADLTEKDEEFLEKLGVIAFGTFLAMNAKPELVEKGKLLKRVVKAGQAPREFWSPNVIGPRYRLKREVVRLDRYGKFAADQPKRDLGGTHASPRLHWRRGHFRNQAVGVGRKQREQRWIEPMLVGAGDEAEGVGVGA